ncbi:M50 family metallopeptidase [Priestia megaterium]|uniref:M50 family metallopeptidase n=2 Tax=Priestia megaterium TaxID=1404 RepID=UPI000BF60E84|nr:M50 family metallopeptidase [Priestia megaterium]AUO14641.1 M50 family peptidase [Priestia megaterium]PFJ96602.1 hypothetical protein COI96_24525 [Priestia megaterium]
MLMMINYVKFLNFMDYMLLMVLSFFVAVILHELGHLLGAIFTRLKVQWFSFGFIKIQIHPVIRINWIWKNKYFFGGVFPFSTIPIENFKNKYKLRIFFWMGPILSLLFAIISYVIYMISTEMFFLFLGLSSLCIGIMTMLTDGMKGYFIYRSTPYYTTYMIQLFLLTPNMNIADSYLKLVIDENIRTLNKVNPHQMGINEIALVQWTYYLSIGLNYKIELLNSIVNKFLIETRDNKKLTNNKQIFSQLISLDIVKKTITNEEISSDLLSGKVDMRTEILVTKDTKKSTEYIKSLEKDPYFQNTLFASYERKIIKKVLA